MEGTEFLPSATARGFCHRAELAHPTRQTWVWRIVKPSLVKPKIIMLTKVSITSTVFEKNLEIVPTC